MPSKIRSIVNRIEDRGPSVVFDRRENENTEVNSFRGLLLIVPSFVIVGLCSTMLQLYTGLGLYAVSTAFVVPCLTTLVAGYGETHQKVNTQQTIKTSLSILTQGIVTGVFRSLGALGRAAGPIFGSFLYWSLGPELSYAIGGFGLLIPYFMLRRLS